MLGRLAQGGHPAFLSPVEVKGRTMYRVRIGPYAERELAEQVADTVRRTFKLDTWITAEIDLSRAVAARGPCRPVVHSGPWFLQARGS